MKKLLLTGVSVFALTFGASAQVDNLLWDGDTPDNGQLLNGEEWFVFDRVVATVTDAGTGSAAGNEGNYLNITGPTTGLNGYYVGGAGNMHFNVGGTEEAIGINGTVAENTLKFDVTTNGTSSKLKVELVISDLTDPTGASDQKWGIELDFTTGALADAKAGWIPVSIPFSTLAEVIADNPTGLPPTDDQIAQFSKMDFVLICTEATGDCTGEANIDNIVVNGPAIVSSVKPGRANIASSVIYPNPATENATVKLNLKSTSNVKVTLSDMMGREVAVVAEGSMNSMEKSFDVSEFTKGLYTVNYFINGAPAKAELLMVR